MVVIQTNVRSRLIGITNLALTTFPLLAIRAVNPFENHIVSCIILDTTGVPCPGCGGIRALWLLSNGQLHASLMYNPLIASLLIMSLNFSASYISGTFSRIRDIFSCSLFLISLILITLARPILSILTPEGTLWIPL